MHTKTPGLVRGPFSRKSIFMGFFTRVTFIKNAPGPNALNPSTQIAQTMMFHVGAASPDLAEAIRCILIHKRENNNPLT
jgi:hypothetical protein